jgi:mRNA interferase HigB
MRWVELIGQRVLSDAGRKSKPLRTALTLWAATVRQVAWASLTDVRRTYPNADGVALASGTIVTVFNIKGRQYRLLAWIDYDAQVVEALAVLTHAEYSKDLWKEKY